MRTIKFRAWNIMRKEMAYPNGSDWLANFWQLIEEDPDNFEVMQFTGLLDKNGKEIYEGDIMRRIADGTEPREIYEVVYNRDGFEFAATGNRISLYTNFEVIGNIYSNPGLLK